VQCIVKNISFVIIPFFVDSGTWPEALQYNTKPAAAASPCSRAEEGRQIDGKVDREKK
jgi:hypothetical protein